MPAEITGELHTVLTQAAFAPISNRAFLRITGPDAPRWLNGMVTNNVQALNPGEGSYNFLLNAQGRIEGDCTIYRDPHTGEPTYLLETDKAQIGKIQQLLDKFIIMDDVELNLAEERPCILLVGERAPVILGGLNVGKFLGEEPAVLNAVSLSYRDAPPSVCYRITAPFAGLAPGFELAAADEEQGKVLAEVLAASTAHQISPETLEALRILEARPRYGTDIRNTDTSKDLPQETNQSHALHFAKGCYLGQEIVERIRSRGQVHRLFTPFRLESDPPTSFPMPLEANGKPAGELTSGVAVETTEGPVWLALGYARREALDTHATLTYPGGTALPRTPGKLT